MKGRRGDRAHKIVRLPTIWIWLFLDFSILLIAVEFWMALRSPESRVFCADFSPWGWQESGVSLVSHFTDPTHDYTFKFDYDYKHKWIVQTMGCIVIIPCMHWSRPPTSLLPSPPFPLPASPDPFPVYHIPCSTSGRLCIYLFFTLHMWENTCDITFLFLAYFA
jgi:hypothetical protein